MSDVLHMLPRVGDPADVDRYVTGRKWHYLCGVTVTEFFSPVPNDGDINHHFNQGFRDMMSSGTGFTSG
jgi:hypothetical protein